MTELDPAETDLVTLAERLLWHPHPYGNTSVEVVVGRLPDAVVDLLPFPAGARLLGSAVHRQEGRLAMAEAVFDTDEDPAALLGAYQAELLARGWTPFEEPRPMQGFVSGDMGARRAFSLGDDGPLLSAAVTSRDRAPSDLRLRLDWETRRRMRGGPHQMPGMDLMPPLRAPAGVSLQATSGSGSEERWTTESMVDTERSVADLERHFAAQLRLLDWTQVAGSSGEAIAWSSWTLPDEERWRGFLLVAAPFGGTERFLTLRLDAQRSAGADRP